LGQFPFLGGGVVSLYDPWIQIEIWVLLFFATLFVSMLFINTLVTVIGAVYEELWEDRIRYGMMESARLFADHLDFCTPKIPAGPYIYVVTSSTEKEFEDKIGDFNGEMKKKMSNISESIERNEKKMEERFARNEAEMLKITSKLDQLLSQTVKED
jgi:hypothetical protein